LYFLFVFRRTIVVNVIVINNARIGVDENSGTTHVPCVVTSYVLACVIEINEATSLVVGLCKRPVSPIKFNCPRFSFHEVFGMVTLQRPCMPEIPIKLKLICFKVWLKLKALISFELLNAATGIAYVHPVDRENPLVLYDLFLKDTESPFPPRIPHQHARI